MAPSQNSIPATSVAIIALLFTALSGCGDPRRDGDGPDAWFIGPAEARPGEALLFDASSTQEAGLKMSHRWDFGDGTKAVISFDAIAEHTFDEEGEFDVRLTVTDDLGNTGERTQKVLISAEPEGCDRNADCPGCHTYCVDRACLLCPRDICGGDC